jgi:hypothetical protein
MSIQTSISRINIGPVINQLPVQFLIPNQNSLILPRNNFLYSELCLALKLSVDRFSVIQLDRLSKIAQTASQPNTSLKNTAEVI